VNKQLLSIALIAVTAFSACKEKGPYIDLGSRTAKDSTYTAAAETPQQRIILVEDFTGASCPNCPSAHTVLESIETQHPGRLAIMALHILNFTQAEPQPGAQYDFRTQDATDISNTIYGGVSLMPSAGINRLVNSGNGINPPNNNLFGSFVWSQMMSAYLDSIPPVNVTITSSLNTTGDTAFIQVRVAYTQAVTAKNTLTVAITEGNMIDKQEDQSTVIDDYEFNDVLRGMVSPALGSPMLDSVAIKATGRVFTRSYLYKVDGAWNKDHCKVVAFVANAESGDKRVLQAAVAKLKP